MLLSEAKAYLRSVGAAKLSIEKVPLLDALGRIAASEIESTVAIPPADNSAMDGFAVNTRDLVGTDELRISQRIPAGKAPEVLVPGTAARIFTGANMPAGADAVVIQENCEYDDSFVRICASVAPGSNIRPLGQDIRIGAVVVKKGQQLNAVDLSLLASIGISHVPVFERLTVAIFSTGDELVEPGEALGEGQIYNSNRPLLLAMCKELGYEIVDCGIVEDTLKATKEALFSAAQCSHLILSSGGVSVGDEDHIKPAVESMGSLDMWKVQMKPGKPVAYGQIDGTPFLGLPGNPVSSFVVFQLLGVPLMSALQRQLSIEPVIYNVRAGFDKSITSREEYIRVKLIRSDHGELIADRFENLSSGVLSSLSWADGLVRHDIGEQIVQGQTIPFLPLKQAML